MTINRFYQKGKNSQKISLKEGKELMRQEIESEDDDSESKQQTEILKKPDIKDVKDAISII